MQFWKSSGIRIQTHNSRLSSPYQEPQLCGRPLVQHTLWEIITIENVPPYVNIAMFRYVYLTGWKLPWGGACVMFGLRRRVISQHCPNWHPGLFPLEPRSMFRAHGWLGTPGEGKCWAQSSRERDASAFWRSSPSNARSAGAFLTGVYTVSSPAEAAVRVQLYSNGRQAWIYSLRFSRLNVCFFFLFFFSYLPWFEVFYKLLNVLADYSAKGQVLF